MLRNSHSLTTQHSSLCLGVNIEYPNPTLRVPQPGYCTRVASYNIYEIHLFKIAHCFCAGIWNCISNSVLVFNRDHLLMSTGCYWRRAISIWYASCPPGWLQFWRGGYEPRVMYNIYLVMENFCMPVVLSMVFKIPEW